jgi:hypothetical protein
MLPPEIFENPDLSVDEKIGRLRNLDASLRSLHRALYAPAGETPWLDELVEIEAEIRILEQMLPSSRGTTTALDRSRHSGDDTQGEAPNADQRKGSRRPLL